VTSAFTQPCIQFRILVHEPVSLWTAELERQFESEPAIVLRWRPYREELLEEWSGAQLAILVVGAGDESLELIRVLRASRSSGPAIACLVKEGALQWEWCARELGADVVLSDLTEKARVADALRRIIHAATPASAG